MTIWACFHTNVEDVVEVHGVPHFVQVSRELGLHRPQPVPHALPVRPVAAEPILMYSRGHICTYACSHTDDFQSFFTYACSHTALPSFVCVSNMDILPSMQRDFRASAGGALVTIARACLASAPSYSVTDAGVTKHTDAGVATWACAHANAVVVEVLGVRTLSASVGGGALVTRCLARLTNAPCDS